MIPAVAESAERLARLVEEVSGNVVSPGQYPFLTELARERAGELGFPAVATYLWALERGALPEEWRDLLPRVTVKESYLFRAPQQFREIRRVLMARWLEANAPERRLRIWSAGCACGEEPATLAIVLAEDERLAGWEWRIDATDVDERALERARSGLFSAHAMANVPDDLRQRYFEPRGDRHQLAAHLLHRIDFRVLNLIREPFPFPSVPYDLILLRNVLIYFRLDSQRRVVSQAARSLARHGALFLGPAETLWQISTELEPIDFGDCFAYSHAVAPPAERAAGRRPPSGVKARRRPQAAVAFRAPLVASLEGALEATSLGTRERVESAALRLAEGDAEACFRLIAEALRADPVDPAAHTLEGCAHGMTGARERAVVSFRAALFLEPNLFQARYWLAEILHLAGDLERSRHELRETLATLDSGRGRELRELRALASLDAVAAREGCLRMLRTPA